MWKTIQPEQIQDNPFTLIAKDHLLLTACEKKTSEEGDAPTGKPSALAVNWGGLGVLWSKCVATIYLRPTQSTKALIDGAEEFSLCVLPQKYKSAVDYCKDHPNKAGDNLVDCKLDVEYTGCVPWIKQARLVLFCQKLYAQELDPFCFSQQRVYKQNYRKDDLHTMYIAEIVKVMTETRGLA